MSSLSTAIPSVPAIPEEVVQGALTLIQQIHTLLRPYLRDLDLEQRKSFPRVGAKAAQLIRKGPDYARSHPEFVPGLFTADDLVTSVANTEAIGALRRPVALLNSQIEDTEMVITSDAYLKMLAFYQSVKSAARLNAPDAEQIANDLGKAFAGMGPKGPTGAPTPHPGTPGPARTEA